MHTRCWIAQEIYWQWMQTWLWIHQQHLVVLCTHRIQGGEKLQVLGGLSQRSLKKPQILQVLGKTDGICRKMLRDCLMKLKGYSLLFQKVWRSGKVSNWIKINTAPIFKKPKIFFSELHISRSHLFPGRIIEKILFETISGHKKLTKWLRKGSINLPRINHAWQIWSIYKTCRCGTRGHAFVMDDLTGLFQNWAGSNYRRDNFRGTKETKPGS